MGPWRVSAPMPFLALLGFLQRIAATPLSQQECANLSHVYYNEADGTCCFQCPAGYLKKTKCPLDLSTGCVKKTCGQEYYLNRRLVTPQCQACVKCAKERDLVEISPCTPNSSRVCACKSGWYCQTPVSNSCSRCSPHSSCKPGFGVRTRGTADKDTICENCPPGTFSDEDSSTQPCKTHTNCAKLNKCTASKGNATHDKRCTDPPASQLADATPVSMDGILLGTTPASLLGTMIRGPVDKLDSAHSTGNLGTTVRKPTNNASHVDITIGKTLRRGERDFALLGVLFLLGLMLCACSAMVWRRRACNKWIVPHKVKLSNRAKICAKQMTTLSSAGNGLGEGDPGNTQPLTEAHDGDSLLEMEKLPGLTPWGAELVQADGGVSGEPPPQCTNCIEKIYIMRADTVIVGSISEVPSGKTCTVRDEEGSSGIQEDIEEKEVAVHYPEQETEFCPGSDITTPVEEEWEFHYSAEKTLAI